jgi:hypothetical protein
MPGQGTINNDKSRTTVNTQNGQTAQVARWYREIRQQEYNDSGLGLWHSLHLHALSVFGGLDQ